MAEDCRGVMSGGEMTLPQLTRRRFVSSALASGAIGSSLSRPSSRGARLPRKFQYIDIHTHLGTFYWGKPLTADELVRMMDRHGVEKSCVLPLVSPESSPYPQTTEAAIAAF